MPVDVLSTLGLSATGAVGCFAGVKALLRKFNPRKALIGRGELEQRVTFLKTVPLFRRQLPQADLPCLAGELTTRIFRSGRCLVRQGDTSDEFFLIESGEALVLVDGEERGTLSRGDHWGDVSLVRNSTSPATIQSLGPGRVTVLTLTRREFERLGLHERLSLPSRPAVYNGKKKGQAKPEVSARSERVYEPLPSGEDEFICQTLRSELSLREIFSARAGEQLEVARAARMCKVHPNTNIVECGDFSQECFVIKSGTVEVYPEAFSGPRSAEFVVAISNLRRRYKKKDDEGQHLVAKSRSMFIGRSRKRDFLHQDSVGCFPKQSSDRWLDDFFPPKMKRCESARTAGPEKRQPVAVLGPGDIFGHITMFHNARYSSTFRSAPGKSLVLYSIERASFKHFLCKRRPRQFAEWCELLDEVTLLAPLFGSERRELARHASGYKTFAAGELVVEQGKATKARMWYVLASGTAFVSRSVSEVVSLNGLPVVAERKDQDAELRRGDTFGERSLLDAACQADYSVRAGGDGMVCLCLESEVLLSCGLSREVLDHSLSAEWLRELAEKREQPEHEEGAYDPAALEPLCVLGAGSFGFVVLQRDKKSRQLFALKRMSKGLFRENQRQHICAERDLMSLTDSNFIVRLVMSWRDEQFLYLLQEPALGGSLARLLYRERGLFERSDAAAMFYVGCVTAALEHLHERSIIYRDLKSENVLLDERGYAKLCDMGFARFVLGKTYTCCGTPEYMAPELIDFAGYSFPVDWWSLGVLACELLTGNTPWEVEYSEDDDAAWITDLRKSQDHGIPDAVLPRAFRPRQAAAFVRALLRVRPGDRLGSKEGAAEVRTHPWFQTSGFDFSALSCQRLPAPHSPEAFIPQGPAPDLRMQVPITRHNGCSLIEGADLGGETVTLEEALQKCAADSMCEAFCCKETNSGDEKVHVTFKAHSAAVKQPGWVTFRKRPEIFERHVDDGTDWDKTFALPAAVRVGRRAAKVRRSPEELW